MDLPSKNQVLICKNFLTKEECQDFLDIAPQVDLTKSEITWSERTKDITQHEIVDRVSDFLESETKAKFKIKQAQIQNWFQGSSSDLHVHNYDGREDIVYNSLIYLNDNYEGGQFYTETLEIKPEIGMLTLFNGQKTHHGVKQVIGADRYTLIFWWQQ